jgi:hypothetical protein
MQNRSEFELYLMSFFTAYDWAYPVQSKLGWTKMRLGKYVAYPETMPFERVVELSKFLTSGDTWITSIDSNTMYMVLTRKWNCGKNSITKSQDESYAN